jgi:hypothetical protein
MQMSTTDMTTVDVAVNRRAAYSCAGARVVMRQQTMASRRGCGRAGAQAQRQARTALRPRGGRGVETAANAHQRAHLGVQRGAVRQVDGGVWRRRCLRHGSLGRVV